MAKNKRETRLEQVEELQWVIANEQYVDGTWGLVRMDAKDFKESERLKLLHGPCGYEEAETFLKDEIRKKHTPEEIENSKFLKWYLKEGNYVV